MAAEEAWQGVRAAEAAAESTLDGLRQQLEEILEGGAAGGLGPQARATYDTFIKV